MTRRLSFILSFFLVIAASVGQSGELGPQLISSNKPELLESGRNQLTIFVIPAKAEFDWSSPRSLFKSYFKNYRKNFFTKKSYTLGHVFVELCTPLASGRIFAGMRAASSEEMKSMVLKEHYGYSILGADMQGHLETEAELVPEVEKYSRKGRLAFITFFVSDETAAKMLQFFQTFKDSTNVDGLNQPRYGGAFWPRYIGEGSGCSAFAVSFLDLAGLLKDEFYKWMININIPMDLIGGPYNNNHKVHFSKIKSYRAWGETEDSLAGQYEPFGIYDPTLIYNWIEEKWDEQNEQDSSSYTPIQLNKAKGILIDSRYQSLPIEKSIFIRRDKPSIFIDYYNQRFPRCN
jgi:hypothetical protein